MHQASLLRFALAMALFGSVGFFSKLTGLPYIELIAVRLLCAALLLFVVWLVKREGGMDKLDRREVGMILLCAVANLLNWICLYASFEKTSVTIAISLYHLAPIFVLIAGRFLFREKWTTRTLLALSLCFIGTISIMGLKAGGHPVCRGRDCLGCDGCFLLCRHHVAREKCDEIKPVFGHLPPDGDRTPYPVALR
ncbi:membrane hypothetical protein [Bacillus sp. 349Y]|nr:membrane hypothetical protein [Bacillus sp. 349Y]